VSLIVVFHPQERILIALIHPAEAGFERVNAARW